MIKIIKDILFGVRAKGETLPTPTFRTVVDKNRPSQDEWCKYVKFSSRYGVKGS
jgi:hypothetical protein